MKLLMTGASGMVGTALSFNLRAAGHTVVPLVRPPQLAGPGQAAWNPATGEIDPVAAHRTDAVVNLAGASIGGRRWSVKRKELLRSSRIEMTRRLIDAMARLEPRPGTLVSASAIGYYGDRGDETLTETSQPGEDFLAYLVRDWEAEARRALELGVRTVILRFGIILSAQGGALAQMLPPFRMGLGGRVGSGAQWTSWIALADATRLIREALENDSWQGTFNAVAPQPVTNQDFTRTLGRILGRPTLVPVPRFALRALFGEMADALLLASQRVQPQRLVTAGYSYLYQELEPALRSVLAAG
ncbi:MAG TPA: TIGR01777 family oxidoreductase [Candidatus Acidoferrales bacterium]|nr:TIGR01777 family oxidoreductase [Candidatus Acidoferrales bacterium]